MRIRFVFTRWMVSFLIVMIVFCMGTTNAFGQSAMDKEIIGRVLDDKSGEPLIGVNVMIKGTFLGAATDANGEFRIESVPLGVYQIEASMIGYKRQVKEVAHAIPGQRSEVEFRLESTVIFQPTVVVTASKRRQNIEDASTSVDIVGKNEIQARNPIALDEVLQNTAGFGVIDGQIDLRGSSGFNWAAGSRVLLMLDGHPLINGDTGGINWDAIPVEEVERVEIVKGAGSALYGSNAMAGMVNIITREPTADPETRVKLFWGFYDEPFYSNWRWTDRFLTYRLFELKEWDFSNVLSTKGIDLSHSRQIGNVGLLLTGGRKTSTGYSQNGDFDRWNFMGKAKVKFSAAQTLTVTGNYAYDDHGDFLQWISQDRPLEVPEIEANNRVVHKKANIHMTYRHGVNDRFAYTIKGNGYRTHWQNQFHDNNDYAFNYRYGMEGQGDYIIGKHALTFGGEIITNKTTSPMYGDQTTWDYGAYIEDEMKLSPMWTLNIGSRFDYHRVVGISTDSQFSPRMGVVCKPWEGGSFRFSAGHGFRAPSIAEVFASLTVSGFRVIPNLDLKDAERAWSLELGGRQAFEIPIGSENPTNDFWANPIKWMGDNFNPTIILDAAVFWSRYRNMIDVDINPDTLAFQFMNIGSARNQGFEIRLMGSFFRQRMTTNVGYTYIDPIDLETNEMLNYRSRHRFNLGATLNFWRITLGWDYRYASRMENVVDIYGSDERVPIHVMDGRIIFDFHPLEFSIEGKNLRNYHYTLRQRFLEPIRQVIFTCRSSF